ncbi:MAG: PQ-loop domain-containing transporter [Minisyncoccota bacterium]
MNTNKHNHFIDKLAFFNGLISGVALYPQVYSILISGSTVGVSLSTFVIIFVNSVVWFLYAIHLKLLSLGVASLLNFVASGILIFYILFF